MRSAAARGLVMRRQPWKAMDPQARVGRAALRAPVGTAPLTLDTVTVDDPAQTTSDCNRIWYSA